ncbi:MAG: condensation domain-containing protein [Mycobacteriales bacterium]
MTGAAEANRANRARVAELLRRRRAGPRTYPLSSDQLRLWFLDQFEPGTALYNVPLVLRLTGALDAAAVQRALDTIVERHAVLRTTFPAEDGTPVQRVAPTGRVPLQVDDLAGWTAGDRLAEAVRRAGRSVRAPFDLAAGPLLRALLVRVEEADHLLALTLHHIVADAWSLNRLRAELGTCYTAYVTGTEPELPELPVQYGDFAGWQRERAGTDPERRQVDYWAAQLAGAPAVLALPTDRPRPPVASHRGATLPVPVPRSLAAATRRLSQDLDATLFMTLAAAVAVVLSRHSGQSDVVVGAATGQRPRAELEDLIGLFVNTVALRAPVTAGLSFQELVRRVRDVALDALGNADVPFSKLVEVLEPERSLASAPVFQVLLLVYNVPPHELAMAGVTAKALPMDTGTAKFDLAIVAEERGDRLVVAIEYATDLFDAETVAGIGSSLTTLLAAVTENPDRVVQDVSLLPATERAELLSVVDLPRPAQSTPRLLADRLVGDRLAVVGEDGSLSAGRVAADANRLAHLLRSSGVGPDVPVGLCLDRSTTLVTALLGVWQAGGGYLPLDAGWPPARLQTMLDDAAVPVVVTTRAVRDRLGGVLSTAGRVLCLDDHAATLAARPDTPPPGSPHPEHLAYLIYTSGSTGRPKGVAVPHRAVTNLLLSFADSLRLTPQDRWAAVTTLSFDIAILELALPLLCGTPVVVVGSAVAADGARLRRLLAEQRVTAMQATPASWEMLLAAGGVPAGVHLRLCGGEALPGRLAAALGSGGAQLWNVYGPTETTVWSSAAMVG